MARSFDKLIVCIFLVVFAITVTTRATSMPKTRTSSTTTTTSSPSDLVGPEAIVDPPLKFCGAGYNRDRNGVCRRIVGYSG